MSSNSTSQISSENLPVAHAAPSRACFGLQFSAFRLLGFRSQVPAAALCRGPCSGCALRGIPCHSSRHRASGRGFMILAFMCQAQREIKPSHWMLTLRSCRSAQRSGLFYTHSPKKSVEAPLSATQPRPDLCNPAMAERPLRKPDNHNDSRIHRDVLEPPKSFQCRLRSAEPAQKKPL